MVKVVEPGADNCRMRFEDLSARAMAAGAEAAVAAVLDREHHTPFEQYVKPPVRAILGQLGKEDHVIIIVLHHVR